MKYNSNIRREDIFLFAATQMDLEHFILSEVSQTDPEKYCMISLTCEI